LIHWDKAYPPEAGGATPPETQNLLTWIKVEPARRADREASPLEVQMTFLLAAVLTIFAAFAAAMAYAEFQTRGIVAPGGKKPN
jgi:hypothetical protein